MNTEQLKDCSIEQLKQFKAELLESNMDRNDIFYKRLSHIEDLLIRKYLLKNKLKK